MDSDCGIGRRNIYTGGDPKYINEIKLSAPRAALSQGADSGLREMACMPPARHLYMNKDVYRPRLTNVHSNK